MDALNTVQQLHVAIAGIGSIAVMPLLATIISAANRARRERRRQAMLNRFNDRLWL